MMSEGLQVEIVDMIETALFCYVEDHLTRSAAEDVFDRIWEYLKEDL